jgi:hypothetical protein
MKKRQNREKVMTVREQDLARVEGGIPRPPAYPGGGDPPPPPPDPGP